MTEDGGQRTEDGRPDPGPGTGQAADVPGQGQAPAEMTREQRTVGYLRVSTADQDLYKFRADVLQFAQDRGFGKVEFAEEKVSGKKPWRDRQLGKVVLGLGDGDKLIVPELSRLGRSMLEILEIIQIARAAGACIYAVKGGWELADNIQSKIISSVLAMMAEVERDLISERTKEALASKKAAGIKLGRRPGPGKSKLDEHAEEIRALLANGSTKTFVAGRYGTSVQNLSHWLRQRGLE